MNAMRITGSTRPVPIKPLASNAPTGPRCRSPFFFHTPPPPHHLLPPPPRRLGEPALQRPPQRALGRGHGGRAVAGDGLADLLGPFPQARGWIDHLREDAELARS